jgi:hypothetical protein
MRLYCCFVHGVVITGLEQTRMFAYYDEHHNKTDEELFQVSIIWCLYEAFCFTSVRPNPPMCMTMAAAQSGSIQQLPSDTT